MAYDEPPPNPPPKRPDGWSDSTTDRDVRRGRHRARHADAAPDAYDDAHSEDSYGFAYGDGVSPQPMYGPAPEGQTRRGHGGPPTGEMPRAGRPPTGAPTPVPVDPSWRLAPPPGVSRPATSGRLSGSGASAQARTSHPGQRALDGPTRLVPQLESPRPENQRPSDPRPEHPRPDARQPGHRWADHPQPGDTRPESSRPGVASNGGYQPDAADITSLDLGLDQPRSSGSHAAAAPADADAPPSPGMPLIRATGDAPKVGRAGRNLPKAIGVGVLLAGIVLGSLFLWRPAFVAVLAVGACVGVWEMVHAFALPGPTTAAPTAPGPAAAGGQAPAGSSAPGQTRAAPASRAEPPLVPLIGGCLVMAPLAYFGGVESLVLGLLVTILAVIVWRLSSGPAGFARDISAATLIATYVPFLLFFGILLARPDNGDLRVLCILAMVVLSDTGGYAAGVFLGKHPMAPSISPKKSWEGLAGSLVAAGVGGAFLVHYLLHQPYWQGAIIGVAVSAAAVLGDLAESMLKRDLGIKDMSNLLPGHGGLMDRLDSVVFAAPTAFVLLAVFAPVAT
jgi:phosphatidate cytidylyltransferase